MEIPKNMKYKVPCTVYRIPHTRSGFTLIEILLVIGISVLLAAIAVPNYINLQKKKAVDSAATRLVFDLRAAAAKSKAGVDDARYRIRLTNVSQTSTFGDYYEVWSDKSADGLYDDTVSTVISHIQLNGVGFGDAAYQAYQDLTFARGTGFLASAGTATMISGSYSRIISFDTTGRIDY